MTELTATDDRGAVLARLDADLRARRTAALFEQLESLAFEANAFPHGPADRMSDDALRGDGTGILLHGKQLDSDLFRTLGELRRAEWGRPEADLRPALERAVAEGTARLNALRIRARDWQAPPARLGPPERPAELPPEEALYDLESEVLAYNSLGASDSPFARPYPCLGIQKSLLPCDCGDGRLTFFSVELRNLGFTIHHDLVHTPGMTFEQRQRHWADALARHRAAFEDIKSRVQHAQPVDDTRAPRDSFVGRVNRAAWERKQAQEGAARAGSNNANLSLDRPTPAWAR
jgi:hypothetical protein